MVVTQDKYRGIFRSECNIGFKLSKSDTCRVCNLINIKISNETDRGYKDIEIWSYINDVPNPCMI